MVRRHTSKEYAEHPYFSAGEAAAQHETIPAHALVLKSLREQLPERARILDVGAGTGDFVRLARSYFEPSAVEPSPFLAERIQQRVGCRVFAHPFEEYSAPESADAVVLMDIIEHAADPRELLSKARETLRPGGLLAITTVDSGCLLYALGPLIERLSGRIAKATYLLERIFCYQHNWYFNRRVLRGIVEEAGFSVMTQEGFEFPLTRLRESAFVLLGLRALYTAQALLGARTEQYLLARRMPEA
jgi:2-polyprenyl-3-methyl-5-hydroxy-6-metoxy-1,4-benzoquinol methylase